MCGPTVACNCAVAIREDNNVLGINSCGLNGDVIPINYLEGNTGGASIQLSNDGYTYTVSVISLLFIHLFTKILAVSLRCITDL